MKEWTKERLHKKYQPSRRDFENEADWPERNVLERRCWRYRAFQTLPVGRSSAAIRWSLDTLAAGRKAARSRYLTHAINTVAGDIRFRRSVTPPLTALQKSSSLLTYCMTFCRKDAAKLQGVKRKAHYIMQFYFYFFGQNMQIIYRIKNKLTKQSS